MRNYFGNDPEFHFQFPLDGDCLNCYDGQETPEGLLITVRVNGRAGSRVAVNEQPAEWNGTCYTCGILLRHYRTTLEAADLNSGEKTSIAVYKLHDPVGKYRLSSDDNILFLQDINDHKDTYQSIFDNPYLAVYKKAHDLYGACVHINIYYEYTEEEMKDFSAHKTYFNLSMMTDRFKPEWQQNADWLKLSFHARKNYPNRPYQNATIAQISRDIELVHREISRFAGKEVLPPVTTLHFGASNLAVTRVLREYGYRGLTGYFEIDKHGEPLVAYHYPVDLTRHVGGRDFWKDNQEDIMYGRIDLVLNEKKEPDQLIQKLEELKGDPHRAGFVSLLMHEEYFYEDYIGYREKFEQLILEPCRWCYEHGYRGALMSETMFE
ncbi:MAG: hypothetical protein DBX52_02145 [Clostridiales bacterium]|nr:MAG: hypothetical protein DBX52_02145 [Clostridiales bacterium]